MRNAIPRTWRPLLEQTVEESGDLWQRVKTAREIKRIFPPEGQEFYALEQTPPERVRVVILGQDPYHGQGQAMGLAFSVPKGTPLPPSLRNIYHELQEDMGIAAAHGDLSAWAKQGVLLLNTVLTVEEGNANSHSEWGWQKFTDRIIEATDRLTQPIAYVLWGSQAQKKEVLLKHTDAPRLILKAPHPSPLAAYRGFFGSKPFSKINAFLISHGEAPIDWSI